MSRKAVVIRSLAITAVIMITGVIVGRMIADAKDDSDSLPDGQLVWNRHVISYNAGMRRYMKCNLLQNARDEATGVVLSYTEDLNDSPFEEGVDTNYMIRSSRHPSPEKNGLWIDGNRVPLSAKTPRWFIRTYDKERKRAVITEDFSISHAESIGTLRSLMDQFEKGDKEPLILFVKQKVEQSSK